MNDAKTKQQVIEKITSSTNILVTVSKDPSVDALSAAIALTVILNKLNKHTTAIFSGQTPPAIMFLDPGKTFESSIDSLRDFIIALDKEKADHLRYKVEGDAVKIFITPYKTTLSSADLEFSQGDYNVELVLALGVENQAHLDGALEAHGSILHDATVITIGNAQGSSSLGSIDWRDDTASSLSEMLVSLTESLQGDGPIIDQQVATALLTGIVAETDRFSNTKTSSKVMSVAAQLMAAGADQQLIAAKLQESHEIGNSVAQSEANALYTQPLADRPATPAKEGLVITHDDVPAPETSEEPVTATPIEPEPVVVAPTEAPVEPPAPATQAPFIGKMADAYALDPEDPTTVPAPTPEPTVAPLLGGMVPSPAPAPVEAPVAEEPYEDLSKRSYLGNSPVASFNTPVNSVPQPAGAEATDIFATTPPAPTPVPELTPIITEPTIVAPVLAPQEPVSQVDALSAVNATFDQPLQTPSLASFSPAPGITLPPPPPLPDFGALPSTLASPYVADAQAPQPERLGDILASPPPSAAPTPAVSSDPGQFKIPGQ